MGNIAAFLNAYKSLNIPARSVKTSNELKDADKIILPGVGSFDHAMNLLNNSGMRDELDKKVLEQKTPVLGICVGMQLLARSSEEGSMSGLGYISGEVKHLRSRASEKSLRLPHMGWNDVQPYNACKLFNDFEESPRFYFLHSYYFDCDQQSDVGGLANYVFDFCCAVHSDNIFGVQFHPEKSHHYGQQLLKNFAQFTSFKTTQL